MNARVQLSALSSLFGEGDSHSDTFDPRSEFVSETARELAEAELGSLKILIRRLEQYDPQDGEGFAYLVRQVLERVQEEQALAAALGIHPATLSRWAGRAGRPAVPPIYARAAAAAAFSKILVEGLDEIQRCHSDLNAHIEKAARRKLASVKSKKSGSSKRA